MEVVGGRWRRGLVAVKGGRGWNGTRGQQRICYLDINVQPCWGTIYDGT